MLTPRIAGLGRILAILSAIVLGTAAAAGADTTTLDGTEMPLVRIDVGTGNVTVKTWNRPTIAIDAQPNAVLVDRQHFAVPVTTLPILMGRVQGPDGPIVLPEETFAVASLGPEPRDVVRITGDDTGPVTVTIPNSTALLVVQTTSGVVAIHHYTGGTFVARVQRGRIRLDRDGGSGFVQIMRGPVLANDSDFDRIRTRTALGWTVFERCRARQIQATSVRGSIVYDGGSFDPGLARFQSESGSVAIGVAGGARLNARGGHVYTAFGARVDMPSHGEGAARAVVGGGGPEVTAASATGSVFLYDGSLHDRGNLSGQWSPVSDAIRRVPGVPFETPREPSQPEARPNAGGFGYRGGGYREPVRRPLSFDRFAAPRVRNDGGRRFRPENRPRR